MDNAAARAYLPVAVEVDRRCFQSVRTAKIKAASNVSTERLAGQPAYKLYDVRSAILVRAGTVRRRQTNLRKPVKESHQICTSTRATFASTATMPDR